MEIRYVMDGGTVAVKCSYDNALNTMLRIAGGVWEEYTKKWVFAQSDWERLLPVLLPHYTIIDDIMGTRYTPEQYERNAGGVIVAQIDELLTGFPDNIYRLVFYLEFVGKHSMDELSLSEKQQLLGFLNKSKAKPLMSVTP